VGVQVMGRTLIEWRHGVIPWYFNGFFDQARKITSSLLGVHV
jgi:hypothetical protein